MTRNLPELTDEMANRITQSPPQRDASARTLVMEIGNKLEKLRARDGAEQRPYYIRLSIERWRGLRRWLPRVIEETPWYWQQVEANDLMPGEFTDGGVQLHHCPVAIKGSKLSKRLTKAGYKPVEFL